MNSIRTSDSIINVTLKIIQVAREIPPIAKKQIPNRGMGFESESVIVEVTERLQVNNLWIMPSSPHVEVVDTEYIYHYEYMVVDGDSGEWLILPFSFALVRGEMKWDGNAKQLVWKVADKAASVAHTSAYRIFLTELFQITTPGAEASRRQALPLQAVPNDRRFGTPPQTPVPTHVDENGSPVLPDESVGDKAFKAVPSMYDDDAPILEGQHKTLMGALAKVKLNSDESRHAIIHQLTGGVTSSSKEITQGEFRRAMNLLKIWELGSMVGTWQAMVDKLAPTVSADTVKDYFALNAPQITLAHVKVLKWVKEHNITPPAKFEQL